MIACGMYFSNKSVARKEALEARSYTHFLFNLFLLLLILFSVPAPARDQNDLSASAEKRDSQDRLDEVRGVAESMRIYRLSDGQRKPAEMVPHPVLRYADTPRTDRDGAVWAVGDKGRPLALMVVYTKTTFERGQWIQAVTSLADSELLGGESRYGGRWSPSKPGVEMHALPNASTPSENRAIRLGQMKEVARRFSGHEFWPADSRHELRLLAQPLHRYDDIATGLVDGAIFALAHDTNPEVFILIEAHGRSSTPKWQYGIARFGFAELHVYLDGQEIWTKPIISSTGPTEPYWLFHLMAH